MDTLTIAAVTKIVTDYMLRVSKWLKISIPGWAVHLLVVGISSGLMFGWSKVNGLPFNVLECLKAALAAVGVDQFANEVSAPAVNTSPSNPVIQPR